MKSPDRANADRPVPALQRWRAPESVGRAAGHREVERLSTRRKPSKGTASRVAPIGAKAEIGVNATNLMTGTGVQQTRSPSPEQAVEAVRNRKDGTRSALGRVGPKGARERFREWTAAEMSVEG